MSQTFTFSSPEIKLFNTNESVEKFPKMLDLEYMMKNFEKFAEEHKMVIFETELFPETKDVKEYYRGIDSRVTEEIIQTIVDSKKPHLLVFSDEKEITWFLIHPTSVSKIWPSWFSLYKIQSCCRIKKMTKVLV